MTWELRCAASVWAGPRYMYGSFHQHTLWDEKIWDWEEKRWKENIRFRTHRFSSVWILLGSGFNFPGLVFGMLLLPISLVKILKNNLDYRCFRPQVHETGSRYNQLDWRWRKASSNSCGNIQLWPSQIDLFLAVARLLLHLFRSKASAQCRCHTWFYGQNHSDQNLWMAWWQSQMEHQISLARFTPNLFGTLSWGIISNTPFLVVAFDLDLLGNGLPL